ncbi:MAG: proton-conducting transporter membrane subunit [Pirellulaceae bacterium]
MKLLVLGLVLLPIAAFFSAIFVPGSRIDAKISHWRRSVVVVAFAQFVASVVVFLLAKVSPEHSFDWLPLCHYNSLAGLMLMLVSFVGWNVSQFAVRYLDGEPHQGRFFRYLAITIGAVSLFVVAGNLWILLFALLVTSLSLHALLLHYPDRPAARSAAWTKFVVSRLGDFALLAATVIAVRTCGVTNLPALFDIVESGSASRSALTSMAWLIVLAAMAKSAQFPLHGWLPETLETPTPVSALMHAGIVNAGGYLLIRLSPIVISAPWALATLAVIGSITLLLAGLSMMVQPSVKRSLAYSTVAQMGFMMVQCGFGAFSAAMLHIVAHSLYKAHAFLRSGSVVDDAKLVRYSSNQLRARPSWLARGFVVVASVATVASVCAVLQLDLLQKPGGIALATVFAFALIAWQWESQDESQMGTMPRTMLIAVLLTGSYLTCFLAVDYVVGADVAKMPLQPMMQVAVSAWVIGTFSVLLLVHGLVRRGSHGVWMQKLYLSALNGFYVKAVQQRVFEPLARS